MKKYLLLFIPVLIILFSCKKDDVVEQDCGYSGHIRYIHTNTSMEGVTIIAYQCTGPMKYRTTPRAGFYCSGDTAEYARVFTDTAGYFNIPCATLGLGFTYFKEGYWNYGKKTAAENIWYLAQYSTILVRIIDTVPLVPDNEIFYSVRDSATRHLFFSDSTSGTGNFTRTGPCAGDLVNAVVLTYQSGEDQQTDTVLYVYCPVNDTTEIIFTRPAPPKLPIFAKKLIHANPTRITEFRK